MSKQVAETDVVVVGGAGHVGLPLAVAFASRGLRTKVYDINEKAVAGILEGRIPFHEDGLSETLRDVLDAGLFGASSDPEILRGAESVVLVIGTTIDKHLNPDPAGVSRALTALVPYLSSEQLIVLRSTVFPGVTRSAERLLNSAGIHADVVFCPERIAEGKAMTELFTLPQIVGGRDEVSIARASKLFGQLTSSVVELTPEEAELAKLYTNTYRYIKFATANQFFQMANNHGLDYERIRHAIALDYPRAADLPAAGFAAGPCLVKDTMQLSAFTDNSFLLGHSAMLVNEGLPLYLVTRLEARFDLADKTVGILGAAFKAESDDTRASLAYKLRKILDFKAAKVLMTDPHVTTDPDLVSLETVLEEADVLIIGAPHKAYRGLEVDIPVVDIWNLLEQGTRV